AHRARGRMVQGAGAASLRDHDGDHPCTTLRRSEMARGGPSGGAALAADHRAARLSLRALHFPYGIGRVPRPLRPLVGRTLSAAGRHAARGAPGDGLGDRQKVLAHWRRVHQAAVLPQLVQAAIDLERAVLAEIAVEAFAVIPDLLDDVDDPLL